MGKFSIIDIAISLFLFVLWLTITLTIMSILFNPFETYRLITNSFYTSDAPLWGKLCISFLVILIILPTTPYVKSYYATLGDVILFIFRKKKFKEVTYHFDVRRW